MSTTEELRNPAVQPPSRGFWRETWVRFRRRKLAMVALLYVIVLALIAIFSPAIVGTKPVVCYYKGSLYFPALGYLDDRLEPAFYRKDRFRGVYRGKLKEKDPDSWAIWPLKYQDPERKVRKGEWEGVPANPTRDRGKPNRYNLFGTTSDGQDVFAIMVHGTRKALLVGFVSMSIAATIGITLGALAGYIGGWVDMLLSRAIEVVMCIPPLALILFLVAMVEKRTVWHVMVVLGFTTWTGIARLTRAEFLKLKEMDFIAAARALGLSRARIMFQHVLRNALAPVLVPITFGIASAILTETALSFLGLGEPPPSPSWGQLLLYGSRNTNMWWLVLFPGVAVFLTVMAYNFIGEGLQEATDPRLRQAQH